MEVNFHDGTEAKDDVDVYQSSIAQPEENGLVATTNNLSAGADAAQLGGIDFNTANFDLIVDQSRGDSAMAADQVNSDYGQIQGLVPHILSVVPLSIQQLPALISSP